MLYEPATAEEIATVLAAFYAGSLTPGYAINFGWKERVQRILPGPATPPGWSPEAGLLDAQVDAIEALNIPAALATKANASTVGALTTRVTAVEAPIDRTRLASDVAAAGNAASHAVLRNNVKRAKGGVIGTGGKIAVALRVDHGVDQFLSTFWPLLKARGMPASMGINPTSMVKTVNNSDPTTTTWAQLFAAHREGFEIWSHCSAHLDPAATGNSLEYEIVESKKAIEAQGFVVNGISSPGISPCLTPDYSGNFNPATSWTSYVGRLYLANYALIEASNLSWGAMRYLPTDGCYDLGHFTLDGLTQAAATAQLDQAIAAGASIEFMFHPKFIFDGTVTMTTAAFTGFLDYLQTKRDAGLVEILTSSGLAFADDGSSRRVNLIRDGGLEGQTSLSGSSTPWVAGAGTGAVINSDGGHTGSKYIHIPVSAASQTVAQSNATIRNFNVHGQTMIAEAWARCTGANNEARMTVTDPSDSSKILVGKTVALTVAGGWTKIRSTFTLPTNMSGAVQLIVYRGTGSGDVDFDDIGMYPV